MKIIESIEEMQRYSIQLRGKGKTLANVSTTGFLHKGHLHLVDIAKENADEVVLNIDHIDTYRKFKQEPHKYDQYLEEYRTEQLDKDLELCEKHGVDIFFHPDMRKVYISQTNQIHSNIKKLRKKYQEWQFVDSSISKSNLKDFNMMMPDIIMMGQKDIFQNLEAQFMITDFNFPIKMIMTPIVRESDGVASSSRLKQLSDSERKNARSIYESLKEVEEWVQQPDGPSIGDVKELIRQKITKANGQINYIVVCCAFSLEELRYFDRKAVVVVDATFGTTPLSDNIIIEPR
jgi:pantoate--beta-alanine ligase